MAKQHDVHASIFIGIAVLIIGFLQFGCSRSTSLPKGEVIILDTRNSKEPEENLVTHKQYDVEVYRTYSFGNSYNVRHYHKENDSLISYTAIYGDEGEFDKAAFTWINDTSVSIRIYNTTSKKEKKFTLSGFEQRNSMKTYD